MQFNAHSKMSQNGGNKQFSAQHFYEKTDNYKSVTNRIGDWAASTGAINMNEGSSVALRVATKSITKTRWSISTKRTNAAAPALKYAGMERSRWINLNLLWESTARQTKIARNILLQVHFLKNPIRNVADYEHDWLPLKRHIEIVGALVDGADDTCRNL